MAYLVAPSSLSWLNLTTIFWNVSATPKQLSLSRYLASLRTSRYDEPDMTGKSAMDCAIYKMSKGEIDPREIEPRFMSFVTVERRREMAAVHTKNLQSIKKLQAV